MMVRVTAYLRARRSCRLALTPDTYPGSVSSPELALPLKFRASGIQACDHSECFLWSYDLHRLYNDPARPPRIYMNPTVQVAYEDSWYRWHHTILRRPVIKFWVGTCGEAYLRIDFAS